jgi:hypothetical protein
MLRSTRACLPSPAPACCRLLAAYGGEAALRASFFTSLKEAACICRGSAQRVMEMAAGAQVLGCVVVVVEGDRLGDTVINLSGVSLQPAACNGLTAGHLDD